MAKPVDETMITHNDLAVTFEIETSGQNKLNTCGDHATILEASGGEANGM